MPILESKKKSLESTQTKELSPQASEIGSGRWRAICAFALSLTLVATVPTVGDFGLTWDEPAYRFSQNRSAQWWEQVAGARTIAELRPLLDPDALLFYWTYGRYGINFHPPLAGQLNLLTHVVFGRWMKDIPARRMASVLEFSLTVMLGFVFLSKRYGLGVGTVAAGALLFMPRVYGQAHLIETDTTGLLLWISTALAFWKGLTEPHSRAWRVLVGVLMGLAFVEKMAAVFVLAPLLIWLLAARLPSIFRRGCKWDWIDGLVTTTAMIAPLGVAFLEILQLSKQLPQPNATDLLYDRPQTRIPGLILAFPLAIWLLRRFLGKVFPKSALWGTERPALEIWTSVLAFAPVVGWLGNPSWWRVTLPRLAHYYLINTNRRGSLPDIQILYLGQIYEYSLPWHNAWVLIAITVPVLTLVSAVIGVFFAIRNAGNDRLPIYFLLHLLTLPFFRMLPTPAHDGVRLFLPTFFFLAAFAGWGTVRFANRLARFVPTRQAHWLQLGLAALVIGNSAWALADSHPFELSYYNQGIGGPQGAWKSGFELTYWYDAFNAETLDELNLKLPRGAVVDFMNPLTNPMTFMELQSLGQLRSDIVLGWQDFDSLPYCWLLTQDSKATDFTRLLFVMKPFYERKPRQLNHMRVASVADPVAVSRAWFLSLLTYAPDNRVPKIPLAPRWVHDYAPFLGRLWGEGLTLVRRPKPYTPLLEWAQDDPESLRDGAKILARDKTPGNNPSAQRLMAILSRTPKDRPGMFTRLLLRVRPEALEEAIEIIITRFEAIRTVLGRESYTDPNSIGGYVDEGIGPITQERSVGSDFNNR